LDFGATGGAGGGAAGRDCAFALRREPCFLLKGDEGYAPRDYGGAKNSTGLVRRCSDHDVGCMPRRSVKRRANTAAHLSNASLA
jgi:hypothetical protein